MLRCQCCNALKKKINQFKHAILFQNCIQTNILLIIQGSIAIIDKKKKK